MITRDLLRGERKEDSDASIVQLYGTPRNGAFETVGRGRRAGDGDVEA